MEAPELELSAAELAQQTGCSIVSARRWKRLKKLPARMAVLARVLVFGELELIDPAWRGWRLRAGELVSPEDWRMGPGDILAMRFLQSQGIRHHRLRVDPPRSVRADQVAELTNALERARATLESMTRTLEPHELDQLQEQLEETRRRRERSLLSETSPPPRAR